MYQLGRERNTLKDAGKADAEKAAVVVKKTLATLKRNPVLCIRH